MSTRWIQAHRIIIATLVVVITLGGHVSTATAGGKDGHHLRQNNPPASSTISGTPLRISIAHDLASALFLNGTSQIFDDFDSGTFVQVDNQVYGSKPTGSAQFFTPIPFTTVANNGPTGKGTEKDPYTIVTTVDLGHTGLRLTENISYVNGQLTYETNFSIENTSSNAKSIRLFHAADLYLDVPGNIPDFGVGLHNGSTGAIGARSQDGRVAQVFLPHPASPPNAYQDSAVNGKRSFWAYIGGSHGEAEPGFNNTIDRHLHDAAAGLQWNRIIAPKARIILRDRFGIGPTDVIAQRHAKASEINVIQRASPNLMARHNGIITYSIVARNDGKGNAKNAVITMPFDPTLMRVLDAQFSRAEAWVSRISTNALEIQTGFLGRNNDVITATVRFSTLSNTIDNTSVSGRLSYTWSDDVGGGVGQSNHVSILLGEQDRSEPIYTLQSDEMRNQDGPAHVFSSTIFAPNEPVALWYDTSDGAAVAAGTVRADSNGSISFAFTTQDLDSGNYTMVAHGLWTEFTATHTVAITQNATT